MATIQINNIHKHFRGIKALDGITCEIRHGQITSLVGPNGSGKSTLMNVLTGVYPVTSGDFSIGEKKIRQVKPFQIAQYKITRTFQDARVFEQMTVLENIMIVLSQRSLWGALKELSQDENKIRAQEILAQVTLSDKADNLAQDLSYGQRKLLETARVLAMDAEVILFDEIFSGLFPEMIKTITNIIQNLRDSGKTIVLIEHNMDLIRKLSDWVIVLDSGRLLAEGEPEIVLEKPAVIEAYLGV